SVGSTSRALGSEDRSGSLVQQLETGSLGNGISGSLDPLVGSVYGMPPWITGEQGTVPVLDGPTRFEQLVTGPTSPNESINRYGVAGTDLGIMWDNGDAEDPEVLMAFGDTKIGRASCRERGEVQVGAEAVNAKRSKGEEQVM